MANPTTPELINEARNCEKRGEYAEALDYYEEIDRRGEIRTEHLIAMGNCLLQTRQRQDARKAWLRAFEMSPGSQAVVDLLDRNFKGWEKSLNQKRGAETGPPPPAPGAEPKLGASVSSPDDQAVHGEDTRLSPDMPPPPAPGAGGQKISISVETPSAFERTARPTPPPREESNRPGREDTGNDFERSNSLRPTNRPAPPTAAPAARPVPASANRAPAGSQLPPINWDYIMADAMAESGPGR